MLKAVKLIFRNAFLRENDFSAVQGRVKPRRIVQIMDEHVIPRQLVRRVARQPFEYAVEISYRIKAAREGYFRNVHIPRLQHFDSKKYSDGIQIISEGHTENTLEKF